jgi:hypothetical protein
VSAQEESESAKARLAEQGREAERLRRLAAEEAEREKENLVKLARERAEARLAEDRKRLETEKAAGARIPGYLNSFAAFDKTSKRIGNRMQQGISWNDYDQMVKMLMDDSVDIEDPPTGSTQAFGGMKEEALKLIEYHKYARQAWMNDINSVDLVMYWSSHLDNKAFADAVAIADKSSPPGEAGTDRSSRLFSIVIQIHKDSFSEAHTKTSEFLTKYEALKQ